MADFVECDACRAKPGSPQLCTGCLANRATITAMRAKLSKLAAWLDRLGCQSEKQAETSRNFSSLADACRADAKNYRATAADIRKVL